MILSKITRSVLFATILISMAVAETVSISGVVLDEKGKGVKKIDVILMNTKKKEVAKVATDRKGNFNFSDIKPNNYYLRVTDKKKGDATVMLKAWPKDNQDISDLEVTLSTEKKKSPVVTFGPEPPKEPVAAATETAKPESKPATDTSEIVRLSTQIEATINGVKLSDLDDDQKSELINLINKKLESELGIDPDLINTVLSDGSIKATTTVKNNLIPEQFELEKVYETILDSAKSNSKLEKTFADASLDKIIKKSLDESLIDKKIEPPPLFFSQPLFFDGVDDYADAGLVSTNFATADFTIEAWIKTSSSNQGILIKNDDDALWEKGEKVFYIDQSGRPAFVGYGNNYLIGNKAVNDGQWHHTAVVWDYSGTGTDGTGMIYVDGVRGISNNSYDAEPGDGAELAIKIGAPNFQAREAFNYFSGMIHELRIWSTARTEQEIVSQMYETLFGQFTALHGGQKHDDLIAAWRDSSGTDDPGMLNTGRPIYRSTDVVIDTTIEYFTGEYYRSSKGASPKFGNLVQVRNDTLINFQWKGESPDPLMIPVDNFQVRWTGQFYAKLRGEYKFRTYSDDGVRLYINEKLIIDDWVNHGAQSRKGSIYLEPGFQNVKLEYYENVGGATCELYWTTPFSAEAHLQPLIYQLSASASSASEGDEVAKISIDLTSRSGKNITLAVATEDSTANGNGKDYSSLSKTFTIPAGGKRITFPIQLYDDSMDEYDEVFRVKIMEKSVSNANAGITRTHRIIILDDDEPPSVQFQSASSSIAESGGNQIVILTLSAVSGKDITAYYAVDKKSTATQFKDYFLNRSSNYVLPGPHGTFKGEYYSGGSGGEKPVFGNLVYVREDSIINFQWKDDSPHPSISSSNFQVRWTGDIYAALPGDYGFRTHSDDGVRLYINDSLIIEDLLVHGDTSHYGSIFLKPGVHRLKLEYFEYQGWATCQLYWDPPSGSESLITPLSNGLYAFFPAGITRDTLNVGIINDSTDEHKQTITLKLTEPVNATVGSAGYHTITINDNDPPPSVAFDTEKTSEYEVQGKYPYYIGLSLSDISEKHVAVGWTISTYGTNARANKDFNVNFWPIDPPSVIPDQDKGTVSIKPGLPGGAIGVHILHDLIDEKDETIIFNLKPEPENASLGVMTRHNFTIIDNDDKPMVEFSGDDHGNNRKAATGIDLSSTTIGIIELGGDVDLFRIEHKVPMTILVWSGGSTDLYGEILDGAGNVLASDTDGRDSNNFKIKIPVLPKVTYVRVKHNKPAGTGEYSLMVESSEQYDKSADELVLNKTQAYFHQGHIVYVANKTGAESFNVQRVRVDVVSIDLDLKRFITIYVNDSLLINPSLCYVPSYGRYENLGVIQKNYISNPLQMEGLPRFLPEEMLDHSLVFGVVRDFRTRQPVFGAEVRVFGQPSPAQGSATTLISLTNGEVWGGGKQLPIKPSMFSFPKSADQLVEKGRRITSLDGKFAIAVKDTGILVVRAESHLSNYRIQEKEVRLKHQRGEYYSADIWLLPK